MYKHTRALQIRDTKSILSDHVHGNGKSSLMILRATSARLIASLIAVVQCFGQQSALRKRISGSRLFQLVHRVTRALVSDRNVRSAILFPPRLSGLWRGILVEHPETALSGLVRGATDINETGIHGNVVSSRVSPVCTPRSFEDRIPLLDR